MNRRALLSAGIGLLGVGFLSGCIGRQSPEPGGDPGPHRTPSGPAPSPATDSEPPTPVPFPETCERLPDIEGLPAPPSELTRDTVETFVRDFERVYAVATTDRYGGVDSLRIQSIEPRNGRYVVRVSFDATPVTVTPDATGATPTPHPIDAYTHRAVYRVTGELILREERSHIDDSLLSKTCWTLRSG